jgi:dihydroorotase
MQHISVAESVDLIRRARQNGIKVTGEATPHHITLTDQCVKKFDTNYKMNPPLRSERDRLAVIEGLADGTLTAIATDHAPHTQTAKMVEFDHAPFGIIGLETAFCLSFTELVAKGVLTIPQLISKFTAGPADILGMSDYSLAPGKPADITVVDPEAKWTIDKDKFLSKSRNTPFDGYEVQGQVVMTMVDGKVVFRR